MQRLRDGKLGRAPAPHRSAPSLRQHRPPPQVTAGALKLAAGAQEQAASAEEQRWSRPAVSTWRAPPARPHDPQWHERLHHRHVTSAWTQRELSSPSFDNAARVHVVADRAFKLIAQELAAAAKPDPAPDSPVAVEGEEEAVSPSTAAWFYRHTCIDAPANPLHRRPPPPPPPATVEVARLLRAVPPSLAVVSPTSSPTATLPHGTRVAAARMADERLQKHLKGAFSRHA